MDAPAPATTYRDADSFDIQTSIRTLRQAVFGHVPMIVLTVVVTLSLVLLFVKLFPPIYRAEVLIAGEAQEDQSRTNYYAAWDVFRKGDLKSEPTLMTSRTVAQQVVEQMDLKFDDVHHSVLMHLGYLRPILRSTRRRRKRSTALARLRPTARAWRWCRWATRPSAASS
jgi:uncharacterized protein involved in exopolysaccharide biosynthesis